MIEKVRESISALMDGELKSSHEADAIDDLVGTPELRKRWERYHLVRDVLRKHAYADVAGELTGRLRERLRDEPMHFPSRKRAKPRWRPPMAPLAGVALAASVAVVAILGVRSLAPLPGDSAPSAVVESVAPAPSSTTQIATVGAEGDSRIPLSPGPGQGTVRTAAIRGLQWSTAQPAVEDRLNGYLVTHSEYLGNGMRGMHPYARIVGYDASGRR